MWIKMLTLTVCTVALLDSAALAQSDYNEKKGAFGDAFRTARDNQILSPEAGKSQKPVTGLDGRAGAQILNGYYGTFEECGSAPPTVVNIGGLVAGAGK